MVLEVMTQRSSHVACKGKMVRQITLDEIERNNRGWLRAGICPPVRVHLDGVELRRVVAANRSKGKVRIHDDPPRVDKWSKTVRTRTLYGTVTVELI